MLAQQLDKRRANTSVNDYEDYRRLSDMTVKQ